MKLKTVLDANKKQGKHRDMNLLADLLSIVFWKRTSPKRGIRDIIPALGPKHKKLKMDTLEDNLEFLSNLGTQPFLKVSTQREEIIIYNDLNANIDRGSACVLRKPGMGGRPQNLYSLAEYYINDYFSKSVELESGIVAAIRCNEPPEFCPDSCKDMHCFRDEKEAGRNSDNLV